MDETTHIHLITAEMAVEKAVAPWTFKEFCIAGAHVLSIGVMSAGIMGFGLAVALVFWNDRVSFPDGTWVLPALIAGGGGVFSCTHALLRRGCLVRLMPAARILGSLDPNTWRQREAIHAVDIAVKKRAISQQAGDALKAFYTAAPRLARLESIISQCNSMLENSRPETEKERGIHSALIERLAKADLEKAAIEETIKDAAAAWIAGIEDEKKGKTYQEMECFLKELETDDIVESDATPTSFQAIAPITKQADERRNTESFKHPRQAD